ncbi:hypothetical protein QTO34_019203 [Cnephaeus nilssonii]|uniref:Ras-GEF domain-containing protein n=1 Tax=Cnephaeus nilssonii TaxID=3371016 RepID=A0AA40HA60_CNENI|nr:hypothetical protein QTO34_019203 [Eptesicus nilssonii]
MQALQKGTLEKVVGSLVPAFPARNIPHICTLMPTHLALSRAQWFLEELLTRKSPNSPISGLWHLSLEKHMESNLSSSLRFHQLALSWSLGHRFCDGNLAGPDTTFRPAPPFPLVHLKQALVLHSLPVKHPVGLVRSLWVELEQLEPREAQWEVLEPSGAPALIRMPTTEPAPSPTTDYPRAVTPKEEKLPILTFPPRLVAEQLTAMDAKAKPSKEHLVSTVRATITQFNHVATCAITTCLGDPPMMAQDMTKVECRTLRNFSSLQAILDALQSMSIHHLKKTWGKVSRRSTVTLKKLCKEDNSLSRIQEEAEEEGAESNGRDSAAAGGCPEIEPEEEFKAWFWALERLSKNDM